jgi:predicted nucleic acid-binding protein
MENYPDFNNKEINYAEYLIKETQKKRYVLDTSVITKWYYKKDEEDVYNASVIYDNLESKNFIFFAPDLLLYELLNIYRIKLELDDSRINKIISEIYDLIVILGINKNTFSKAFLNARKLNISFYDSIYLSLSEDLDALLITADKKLYEAAKNKNVKVIMLTDFLL